MGNGLQANLPPVERAEKSGPENFSLAPACHQTRLRQEDEDEANSYDSDETSKTNLF